MIDSRRKAFISRRGGGGGNRTRERFLRTARGGQSDWRLSASRAPSRVGRHRATLPSHRRRRLPRRRPWGNTYSTMDFLRVELEASRDRLPALRDFYQGLLGLESLGDDRYAIGATELVFERPLASLSTTLPCLYRATALTQPCCGRENESISCLAATSTRLSSTSTTGTLSRATSTIRSATSSS